MTGGKKNQNPNNPKTTPLPKLFHPVFFIISRVESSAPSTQIFRGRIQLWYFNTLCGHWLNIFVQMYCFKGEVSKVSSIMCCRQYMLSRCTILQPQLAACQNCLQMWNFLLFFFFQIKKGRWENVIKCQQR